MKNLPLLIRKTLAWSVHLFTATGAVWGFLALRAIFAHEWKVAIVWMVVAMFVDGIDGMFARWFDVKTYASGLDGALLDNILDYFNYTVVSALFLVEADLLPANLALAGAIAILLTSAYQFTQVDAKTDANSDEYFFKGFPDFWNVMVIYMLVLGLNPWINFGFLVLFNILIFVPIKYIYPTRTVRLKKLTIAFSCLFGVIGIIGVILYPNVPAWIIYASFGYIAYYVGLSLWPHKRDRTAA
jgi:phosphatidylcholine synthase